MALKPWWDNCRTDGGLKHKMADLDKRLSTLALTDQQLAHRQQIAALQLGDDPEITDVIAIIKSLGGNEEPALPFPANPRLSSVPPKDRLINIMRTLDVFAEGAVSLTGVVDIQVLGLLGKSSPAKCWLAASLALTLRAQLDA